MKARADCCKERPEDSALLFGLLGLFFSIITLIVVFVIPRKGR